MPPLTTPDVSKYHRSTAAGKNNQLQNGITRANSYRTAEVLLLQAATKWCRYSFIECPLCDKSYRANTRHWPSFCAPNSKAHSHTTFWSCEEYYPANPSESPPTTSTRMHNTPAGPNKCSETALEHTWTIK